MRFFIAKCNNNELLSIALPSHKNPIYNKDSRSLLYIDLYKKELGNVGVRISKIRMSKNISQKKLSVYAEVPSSSINAIERGKTNPTLATIFALAEALEVDVKEFL
jgi:DNA-binding XRE family transcriptional regulator